MLRPSPLLSSIYLRSHQHEPRTKPANLTSPKPQAPFLVLETPAEQLSLGTRALAQMPSYSRSCGVGLVLYGASHEMDRPRGSHFDLGLLSFNCHISPPLNIAPNPQPLDFEAVESHTVAPVRVLFKEDGACPPEQGGLPLTLENGPRESKSARLRVARSLAAIPCHIASEGRGSKSRTAKTQSPALTRGQTRCLVQQRSCVGRVEAPQLPNLTESRIEPVHFWDAETDDPICVHSFQRRTRSCGCARTRSRMASFV